MNLTYKGYDCEVVFGQYGNGNIAIQLAGKENTDYEAEVISIASVNDDFETSKGVVGIKTWSENNGILKSLIDGNVVEEGLLFSRPTGFVKIEYYSLTDESIKQINQLKEANNEFSKR